jgi:hypothetical protein
MALVDMQMSADEARKEYGTCAPEGSGSDDDLPKYPYGLTINLDDETLAKLGITSLPDVGVAMTLTARVEVCSTSQYQNRDGKKDVSLSLQITAMELSGAAESSPSTASLLYPGS